MAVLKDLPNELVLIILDYVEIDVGVRGIAKLRGICRTFTSHKIFCLANRADAFDEFICSRLFVDHSPASYQDPKNRIILVKALGRFSLFLHGRGQHGFNQRFFNQIRRMLNYLLSCLMSPQGREVDVLFTLCDGLKIILGEYNIALAIMPGDERRRQDWWGEFDGNGNANVVKLVAVMTTRWYPLVPTLLSGIPDTATSSVYRTPLINAVLLGDLTLVRLCMQYLDSLQLRGKDLQHERRRELFLSRRDLSSSFPLHHAILVAIPHDHTKIAATLIQYRQGYMGEVENETLHEWVEAAVDQGNSAIIVAMSVLPRSSSFKLNFSLLASLFATGDYVLVSSVLALTTQPFAHETSQWDLLQAAVRTGEVESVCALVDTGRVDVNHLVRSQVPTYSTGSITALDLAAYRGHVGIVRYLVSQGAFHNCTDLPADMPSHIYKLLRQALLNHNAKKLSSPTLVTTSMPTAGFWKGMDKDARKFASGD